MSNTRKTSAKGKAGENSKDLFHKQRTFQIEGEAFRLRRVHYPATGEYNVSIAHVEPMPLFGGAWVSDNHIMTDKRSIAARVYDQAEKELDAGRVPSLRELKH